MLSLFKKTPSAAADPAPVAAPAPDLRQAVQSIAQAASRLGRDAAEVRGLIEDGHQVNQRPVQALQTLGSQLGEVQRAQGASAPPPPRA